jgi:hypothetical protein
MDCSINRSIDRSIKQTSDRSIKQTINRSIKQTIDRSIKETKRETTPSIANKPSKKKQSMTTLAATRDVSNKRNITISYSSVVSGIKPGPCESDFSTDCLKGIRFHLLLIHQSYDVNHRRH